MYSETVSGVTVYSNVPFDSPIPSGSLYTFTINFKYPIVNILAEYGIDVLKVIDPNELATLFGQQGHTIYNINMTTQGNALIVQFNATSPPVIIAIGIILGIIAIIVWLIDNITTTIVKSPSLSTGFEAASIGILVAAVAGVGLMVYGMAKSPTARENVISATGSAASAAAKGIKRGSEYISNRLSYAHEEGA